MRTALFLGVVIVGLVSGAAIAGSPEPEPVLLDTPYDFTVDLTPPGAESFFYAGQAVDQDPTQTVRIFTGILNPRIEFASTVGNPATFTVRVDGLTYQDFGGYEFFIVAEDSRNAGDTENFTIRLLPEPASTLTAGILLFAFGRRRRER